MSLIWRRDEFPRGQQEPSAAECAGGKRRGCGTSGTLLSLKHTPSFLPQGLGTPCCLRLKSLPPQPSLHLPRLWVCTFPPTQNLPLGQGLLFSPQSPSWPCSFSWRPTIPHGWDSSQGPWRWGWLSLPEVGFGAWIRVEGRWLALRFPSVICLPC